MHRINNTPVSRIRLTAIALLGIGFVWGCTGDTDGGSAIDDATSGPSFHDDGIASLSLDLNDANIRVGQTSGFTVEFKNDLGQAISETLISCDSESGVAIIEPATGRELTSAAGIMSGRIGCEAPGSFEFACRAQTGGQRVSTKVGCEGDIPSGFTGFPGAGGGGLGGGGVALPPGSGGGSPGGTDITDASVSDLQVFDVSTTATLGIDIYPETDCDGDGNPSGGTIDPESYVENTFLATIDNPTTTDLEVRSYTISVPTADGSGTATYTSSRQSVFATIASGSTGTVSGLLTTFSSSSLKTFVGRNVNIPGSTLSTTPLGVRNVTFTFYIFDGVGNSAAISRSLAIDFNRFNNCGG